MQDSLSDWLKMLVMGAFILAGMFCPLAGYVGYQIGSKSIRTVDASTERRNGGTQVCLYFASETNIPIAEATMACTKIVSEVVK